MNRSSLISLIVFEEKWFDNGLSVGTFMCGHDCALSQLIFWCMCPGKAGDRWTFSGSYTFLQCIVHSCSLSSMVSRGGNNELSMNIREGNSIVRLDENIMMAGRVCEIKLDPDSVNG